MRALLGATVLVAAVSVALTLPPAGAGAVSTGACRDLAVGPAEVVVSDNRRDALGLDGWPNGAIGILPLGSGDYSFWALDAFGGPGPVTQRNVITTGTLDDPVAGGVHSTLQVTNVPPQYAWAGGGPVYRDPASGMILQTLHLDRPSTANPPDFWSAIGLGRVDPQNGSIRLLGEIISPELPYQVANANGWTADLGMPSFVVVNHGSTPWFHLYFADPREAAPGEFADDGLSVAGAPVAEVLDAARRGTVSPWRKLYQGTWSEPALGGRSDDLQAGQTAAWAPQVRRSNELNAYFMVAASGPRDVILSTSTDGVGGWSPRVTLFSDPLYHNAFVTIAGRGGDPSDLGHSFFVYYTQWPSFEPNWQNARLMRRAISCAPAPGAAPPPAPSKLRPRGIRWRAVRLTWKRPKLSLRGRGQIVSPPGFTAGCRGGRVQVRLKVGKRRLGTRRPVGRDCRFRVRKGWRLKRRPRARVAVTVKFLGTAQLNAMTGKPRKLRVHRPRRR